MKHSLLLLLTGLVAGIFLAPRKGSETWSMVLEKAGDWQSGSLNEEEDVQETSMGVGATVKKAAAEIKDQVLHPNS